MLLKIKRAVDEKRTVAFKIDPVQIKDLEER